MLPKKENIYFNSNRILSTGIDSNGGSEMSHLFIFSNIEGRKNNFIKSKSKRACNV